MPVKLEWLGYRWWKNYDDALSRFHTIPACHGQTDRQTDGQNYTISISRVSSSMLTSDKNVLSINVNIASQLAGWSARHVCIVYRRESRRHLHTDKLSRWRHRNTLYTASDYCVQRLEKSRCHRFGIWYNIDYWRSLKKAIWEIRAIWFCLFVFLADQNAPACFISRVPLI